MLHSYFYSSKTNCTLFIDIHSKVRTRYLTSRKEEERTQRVCAEKILNVPIFQGCSPFFKLLLAQKCKRCPSRAARKLPGT